MNADGEVVGFGANSVDLVYVLPHAPQSEGRWSKVRIGGRRVSCGGQTATAMAACAALGLSAKYVGAIGADDHGRRVRDRLARAGVDASGLVVREADSQFALILVDERTGERIVLWSRDDRLALTAADLPVEAIRAARILHVDDVDQPAATAAAALAREAGVVVTSDIDSATGRVEELVGAVSYPIFAEHVPPQLTGARDVESALRRLRERFPQVLVVTLGPMGAAALDGDRFVVSPGFAVDAVDTTGAGDVFRGAFIFALLRRWPLEAMLRFANAAAAASCTRHGAIDGVPSLREVEAIHGPLLDA